MPGRNICIQFLFSSTNYIILRNHTCLWQIYIFFLFVFPTIRQLALYISPHLCRLSPSSLPPVTSFLIASYLPSLPPELPPMRMWSQPFFPMLYRICRRAQRNCGKPVPTQLFNRVCPQSKSLWKNDLPLSVSVCRPRTGSHPSKYWPSEKLLDLGDRLAPDTYHTPNTVGLRQIYICYKKFANKTECIF